MVFSYIYLLLYLHVIIKNTMLNMYTKRYLKQPLAPGIILFRAKISTLNGRHSLSVCSRLLMNSNCISSNSNNSSWTTRRLAVFSVTGKRDQICGSGLRSNGSGSTKSRIWNGPSRKSRSGSDTHRKPDPIL